MIFEKVEFTDLILSPTIHSDVEVNPHPVAQNVNIFGGILGSLKGN